MSKVKLIIAVYLPVLLWCGWVYSQTGVFGMSSQRGEHWHSFVMPQVEQSGYLGAWAYGAAKTLLAPVIPEIASMAGIHRAHFVNVEGRDDLEKARNMLTGWLGKAYVANMLILACFYVLCVRGAWRMRVTGAWLMAICVLCVLITGPCGYAKYRLIIEPMLCLLAGRGWANEES